MDRQTARLIDQLDRDQIVSLLESISIQCYDNESTETLREALIVNVEDGTLDPSQIPTVC